MTSCMHSRLVSFNLFILPTLRKRSHNLSKHFSKVTVWSTLAHAHKKVDIMGDDIAWQYHENFIKKYFCGGILRAEIRGSALPASLFEGTRRHLGSWSPP